MALTPRWWSANMKATIEVSDDLYRRAKSEAAHIDGSGRAATGQLLAGRPAAHTADSRAGDPPATLWAQSAISEHSVPDRRAPH